jgi:hypothetical protein
MEWAKTNLPQKNSRDTGLIVGYIASFIAEYVLKQAGDKLTRENIMKVTTNLKDLHAPMLLPGISIHTTPTDYSMINQFQVQQFRNGTWERIGPVVSGGD